MRPIDADVLVADYRICGGCKDLKNCDGHVVMCDSARVRQAINDAPNIETQPVKHGTWKYYKNNGIIDTYLCTNCHDKVEMAIDVEPSKFKYCPNCGARMDGD